MSALPDLYDYDNPTDPAADQWNDEDARERFRVTDDAKAEWALRKLARVRARKATNEQLAEAERERVAAWLADANGSLEHEERFFAGLLEDYARRERDERKSISLPHGTVSTRKKAARIDVTDPDAVLSWAKATHPDAVEVIEKVSKSALNKLASVTGGEARDPDTGLPIPGTTVTPEDLSIVITTN